jgi:hypothetical protein
LTTILDFFSKRIQSQNQIRNDILSTWSLLLCALVLVRLLIPSHHSNRGENSERQSSFHSIWFVEAENTFFIATNELQGGYLGALCSLLENLIQRPRVEKRGILTSNRDFISFGSGYRENFFYRATHPLPLIIF